MKKSDNARDVNLIPGATLCSSINYSDITPMKPSLPSSFSFYILKKFLSMENIVEMPTYSTALSLFRPVCTCTLSS